MESCGDRQSIWRNKAGLQTGAGFAVIPFARHRKCVLCYWQKCPKKWRNQWEPCDSLEEERQRDIKLLTLGNLAIIPQSLNASIRDSSWDIKLAGKANKPGLKICAAGLVTVYDALQKDSWAEADIEDRADWLYENARNIWVF